MIPSYEYQFAAFKGSHVLVIDEDVFMARLLGTVLTSFGVGKVTILYDVEVAKEFVCLNSIDCLMMEWSGWEHPDLELLDFIRKSHNVVNPKVPVVVCTGHTDFDHVMRARDDGANEIVAKPITPQHIFEKLYNAMYNIRDFIVHDAYTGPDRRRHLKNYNGEERRAGQSLPQSDIDLIMVEKDA